MLNRDQRTNKIYFSERVIKDVVKIANYPLTVVEAPMGYGKSVAVKESLKDAGFNDIWITINDDAIGRVWQEMCEGIKPFYHSVANELLDFGPPKDKNERLKVLNIIKNVAIDLKLVIVIDDFHLVRDEAIYKFVEMLAMKEVPNLHVVLIARYFEMRNINELALKGYLNHVTKDAFELDPSDIKKSFKQCGISLKDKEVEQLFAITEGWHMGLCLLRENYNKSDCFRLTSELYKLIENTICANESQEVKDFLQSLSFLQDFNINQAIDISENPQAERLIGDVVHRNGFVSYSEEKKLYHMHPIFTKYLQDHFSKKDKVYKSQYYRRIANYQLKQGNHIEAMENYYKIGDFENLLRTVEADKGHNIHIVNQQRFIQYFEECPKSLKTSHPIAMLIYAICLFSFNEMERFQGVCAEFEEIIQKDQLHDHGTLTALKGEYEVLLSFTKYNDISEMLKHIKNAARLLTEPVKFLDTHSSWTFNSPSVLYMFYREPGTLFEEVQNLKEAITIYRELTNGHGSGSDSAMEGEYHFNRGDWESAEIFLNKALYPANRSGQQDIVICALLLSARGAIAKGDYDLVVEVLQDMLKKVNDPKWSGLKNTVELCKGFIYAQLGYYEKVPTWIREGDLEAHKLYFPAQPFYKIVYGRTLLVHGDYLKILGISEELIEEASFYPNCLSQLYIDIYIAAANYQTRRFNESKAVLKNALIFSERDQMYMPFVENCDYIKPILEEILAEGLYKEPILKILELYKIFRVRVEHIQKKHFSKDKPELTPREREIAILASQGMTNKAIGERLFISPNTVKMALKNIFTKLDINNRALLNQYFS